MANLINFLLVTKPNGLWEKFMYWIESWGLNFGWTIIIFTIFIKLIWFPLDFYNRYSTRKNSLIQKRLNPEVQKINSKYGANKDMANQQINALYKREGYNMIGSCLFMLANLILTLVVFFTIFNALRIVSAYKMIDEYSKMDAAYTQAYEQTEGDESAKLLAGKNASLEAYEEARKNAEFIWIKSLWKADTSTAIVPTYKQIESAVKTSKNKQYIEFIKGVNEERYNIVTSAAREKYDGWNGYYILAILTGALTWLSQFVSEKSNNISKRKMEEALGVTHEAPDPTQASMKMMKFILPIIMVVFALTSTSSFALYLVTSSVMSILVSLVCTKIVDKLTQKEEQKYIDFLRKNSNKTAKKQKPEMKQFKQIGDKI